MSIHAIYARAILQGAKLVEFRKRPLAPDVSHVLVYATKPVGAIVGAFSVVGQQTNTPERLWHAFKDCAGIEHKYFESYFRDSKKATGIQIGIVYAAPTGLLLSTSLGISRPPQSFQYVDSQKATEIIRRMEPISRPDA
jgi:predicted transcriptional regulator